MSVLALAASAAMPGVSSASHNGFTSFRPLGSGLGENGWFTNMGTIEFHVQAESESGSYTKHSIFGIPIKETYWAWYKDVGDCRVDGVSVDRRYLTEDGDVREWVIHLPPKLREEHFQRPLGFTYEGIHEVECTILFRLYESSTWFDFVPGSAGWTKSVETVHRRTVKFDSTPPSVTTVPRIPASLGPQGVNWHNMATVLDVRGTDSGSGMSWCAVPGTGDGYDAVSVAIDGPASTQDKTIAATCANVAGLRTEASYVYRFDDEKPQSDVTVPLARNGWHRGGATLDWGWSDAHSGIKPAACPATSTPSGEGEAVVVSATCTDWAGNQTSDSRTLKVDATAPTIALADRPQPNDAGWHNADVRIDWSCVDDLSGPESTATSRTAAEEGADLSLTGTCTDLAGNTSSDTQSGINLDKTPPVAAPAVSGQQGLEDWYVSPVSVDWHWSDALSGIVADQCRADSVTDVERAGQVLGARCHDLADNTGTAEQIVNVDLNDPQITASADRAPGTGGWYTAPVTVSFSCTDPGRGSGLASDACPQPVTVDEEGVTTITQSVSDRAGRKGSVTTTIKLDLNDPTIAAAADRAPDVDQWYTAPVTVGFTCGDLPPGSGIADCPTPVTVAEEGDYTISGQAQDHAGRRSAVATTDVRVDLAPPDTTLARRGGTAELDGGGHMHGTATDAVSGVREVAIRWTHPSRGAEMVLAEVTCTDATRRVCTWSAKVPPSQGWDLVIVATDRVGREDPTPDVLSTR